MSHLVQCMACGVQKNLEALEFYPYEEDMVVTDESLTPIFELDCEPIRKGDPWKRVEVCHKCFHRLEPDLWIGQEHWTHLDPIIPFHNLPNLNPPEIKR